MSIFYISDLHLCHRTVADRRGFSSVQDHDQTMLRNLQQRLSPNDELCLLGDLFAYEYDPALLCDLRGIGRHILLVRGNHEQHWLRKADPALLSQVFADIVDAAEIRDEGRLVRMCHYPQPELSGDGYILYGHLHDQPPRRADWVAFCGRRTSLNVCAEVGAYATGLWGKPGTLDEWIFFNDVWRASSPRPLL